MLEEPLVFNGYSSIQFFFHRFPEHGLATLSSFHLTVQHLCNLWDTMPHYWSSSTSHPSPGVEKQMISLVLVNILRIYLCLDTYLFSHQKVQLVRFHVCVRDNYGTLYQLLTSFEPTILLIALYVVRRLSYPKENNLCFITVFMIISNTKTNKALTLIGSHPNQI